MSARREATLLSIAGGLFVVWWSISNGRDINWDFLNYHVYTGYASLTDRLAQDYFPANIQSYLLGYVYVPMYLAIAAGWKTWMVQALLGLMCLPTLAACWLLAWRLVPVQGTAPAAWRATMIVGAACSPIFLMEVGTSFADAATAGFVIAAVALSLLADPSRGLGPVVLGGVLAGAGCALKMTNIPMAAAIAPLLLVAPSRSWKWRWQSTLAFGAACAAAFLLIYGPTAWKLFERFGNPFFPVFLNEVFQPPEFGSQSVSLDRFKPTGWLEFLLRPVYMLDITGGLYTEPGAPDVRYLAVAVLAIGYAVQRKLAQVLRDERAEALIAWVGVAFVGWMLTSGNGRYAIPLAMCAGVLALMLARTLWHARSAHLNLIKAICLMLVAIHSFSLVIATNFRWDGREDEAKQYFSPEPDKPLLEQPFLIVNTGNQSVSWLAPFVHRSSRFVSPAGQFTISPNSAAGQKLGQLLGSGLPILVVHRATVTPEHPIDEVRATLKVDRHARLFGLRVDEGSRCYRVVVDRTLDIGNAKRGPAPTEAVLLLCPASYDPALAQHTAKSFSRYDRIFDRVEKACPKLFKPAGVQSICTDNLCARMYMNSDTSMMVYRDGGVVVLGFNAVQPGFLGYAEDILAGAPIHCGSKPGAYRPFSAGGHYMSRPD